MAVDAAGTLIYSPPLRSKSGKDPHLPCRDDGPGVAAWRQRMATPAALAIYKRRSRCELVHAKLRNLRLDRLFVRGRRKVETWMTGFALAMNILTEARLRTTPSRLRRRKTAPTPPPALTAASKPAAPDQSSRSAEPLQSKRQPKLTHSLSA